LCKKNAHDLWKAERSRFSFLVLDTCLGQRPNSLMGRWPAQSLPAIHFAVYMRKSEMARGPAEGEGNTMADQQHLAVLKQGVAAWNAWRRQHPEIHPDLSGADLRHANLMRANLSQAYLSEASLNEANLREADLTEANLREVLLLGADLRHASFRHAHMIGAQLNGAQLAGADFRGADLSGGSLSRAGLHETDFSEANLSKVVITRKW
jgi:uncharacterized protein YjbI with pentapeptide repeats